MSNLLKIIIIMLLIYISYINISYFATISVDWCSSEIQILRDQSAALIDHFKIEMED